MGKVLVTGATGYIGAHIVKAAHNAGHEVHALDSNGGLKKNNISKYVTKNFVENILSRDSFKFITEYYDAVIHAAALVSVGESVKKPKTYYDTNILGTLNCVELLKYKHFIFASSAAVNDPVSPYGKSKLIAEDVINRFTDKSTIFRFYNVAGNNGEFRQYGESTHLIRIAAETAAGKREKMTIYGDDYATHDGTCIRDYVHVVDLADAVVRSINTPSPRNFENIGTGRGYTNLEVIQVMKQVTGKDFVAEIGPRRPGDPAKLVVDNISGYVKINHTLEDMCRSAYNMELL